MSQLIRSKYGRLTMLSAVGDGIHWKVKCDCGIEKTVRLINLQSGNTRSCGCLGRENRARLNRAGDSDIRVRKLVQEHEAQRYRTEGFRRKWENE